MKDKSVRKYLVTLGIFTLLYFGFFWVMDNLFNGMLFEFVERLVWEDLFHILVRYRTLFLILLYLIGCLTISLHRVYRMSRLLRLATSALEDSFEVPGEECPEELLAFGQKLKAVRAAAYEDQQAREQAEQQKNDLVVYLAHDLKTPLTSVIGYLTLLEEAPDLPAEQRAKYVGIALKKAYRLEMLVNEFFDVTRLNLRTALPEKTSVNLTVLLLQMGEELYPLWEEHSLTFLPRVEGDLTVQADRELLVRVLDNLFRNAAIYGLPHTQVICRAYREGEKVHILLSNACEELSPQQMNRLFEKFYRPDTARRSNAGAGLGLAIAKEIMETLGGSVSASYGEGRMTLEIVL